MAEDSEIDIGKVIDKSKEVYSPPRPPDNVPPPITSKPDATSSIRIISEPTTRSIEHDDPTRPDYWQWRIVSFFSNLDPNDARLGPEVFQKFKEGVGSKIPEDLKIDDLKLPVGYDLEKLAKSDQVYFAQIMRIPPEVRGAFTKAFYDMIRATDKKPYLQRNQNVGDLRKLDFDTFKRPRAKQLTLEFIKSLMS